MNLFQADVALAVDVGLAVGDVGLAELLNLLGYVVGLVVAGTDAFLLDEGVDSALEETALAAELHLNDGGVAGDTGEAHAVGGAEVAEAVGDEILHF